MAGLVADCPRCRAQKIAFSVSGSNERKREYEWKARYELFSVCHHCHKATIFLASAKDPDSTKYLAMNGPPPAYSGVLNDLLDVDGFVSIKDLAASDPPEHVPDNISAIFSEGATCIAVNCHNAASAMFRLCVDLATKGLLPTEDEDGLNAKVRRDLGLRLEFLFKTNRLPETLRELSKCIREDGNDGAHAGTIGADDTADLLDFTTALLGRLYTEPARLRLAQERREARRKR